MIADLLFVHIVAVCLWLGGQLFFLAVVIPAVVALKRDADDRGEIIRAMGQQFLTVSIPVLLIILVTGITMAQETGRFTSATPAFQWKMGSVVVVLITTVIHVVASRRQMLRLARSATALTGIATLAAVWFAVHL